MNNVTNRINEDNKNGTIMIMNNNTTKSDNPMKLRGLILLKKPSFL